MTNAAAYRCDSHACELSGYQLHTLRPGAALRTIGRLAGFDLHARANRPPGEALIYELSLDGVPRSASFAQARDVADSNLLGLLARLENRAAGIDTIRAEYAELIRRTGTERDRAAAQLDRPFPHADALATARARALQLAQQLTAAADNHTTPSPAANTNQDRWQATAQRIHPQLAQSPSWTPAGRSRPSRGRRRRRRAVTHPTRRRAATHRSRPRPRPALAPWLPPGRPVAQLAGRRVLLAHGDRDRVTSAVSTDRFAAQLRAAGVPASFATIRGEGHAMLRRAWVWHELTAGFLVGTLLCDAAVPDADQSPAGQSGYRPVPNYLREVISGAARVTV